MSLKRNVLILLVLISIGSFSRFSSTIRFVDFILIFVIGFFSALLLDTLRRQYTNRE